MKIVLQRGKSSMKRIKLYCQRVKMNHSNFSLSSLASVVVYSHLVSCKAKSNMHAEHITQTKHFKLPLNGLHCPKILLCFVFSV